MSFRRKKPPETPVLPSQNSKEFAAPELMDVIDEISGLQTITVTGPDGKKRRVTQRLPLTPQEKQTLSQAENLINQAVNNIESLYKYDPSSVVNYQPFIKAFSEINDERTKDLSQIGNFSDIVQKVEQFRSLNRDLTMREFDKQERLYEENLARRGLQKSTEATEQRSAMARDRALLLQQADINAQNYGQELQSRQLERESRVYGLREQGRQERLQGAELAYNLEKQKLADIENLRQNAINENFNMLNVGQGVKNSDLQKAQLGLAGNNNAISMFNSQAANQNQRFSNEINRIGNQYAMDMQKFKNTPATFGQKLGDLGLSLGGQYLGSQLGGSLSNFVLSSFGNGSPTFGQNIGKNEAFKKLKGLGG